MVELVARYSNLWQDHQATQRALAVTPARSQRERQPEPRVHRIEHRLSPAARQAITDAYVAGEPLESIGRRFAISRRTVLAIVVRAGVSLRIGRVELSTERRAIDLYESGLSLKAVGAEIGRDAGTVRLILIRHNIMRRDIHGS